MMIKVQTRNEYKSWSKTTTDWDTTYQKDRDRSYWLQTGLILAVAGDGIVDFWIRKAKWPTKRKF